MSVALGIMEVDTAKDGDRVSVVNFFEVDYILCERDSKSLACESISNSERTMDQVSNNGTSSLTAPPRPAATVKDAMQSTQYKKLGI